MSFSLSRFFRHTVVLLSSAIVLATTTDTIAATAPTSEPIKIGEFESLTGREAGLGQTSRKGFALAVETINARGGVLGRPLQLVTEDVQSKAGESATAVKKLLSRDKVVALVSGGTSTNALEAAPLADAARVPLVASAATNPRVTEMSSYAFRACFIDPFQGAVLAKLASDVLRVRRVALLTARSAYSEGLASEFRKHFGAAGGTVLAEQRYTEGDRDFRAQFTALRALQPEAIIAPAYSADAGLICRHARELGLNIPIFGGDGWESPDLIQVGGRAVEGTYYASHFSAEHDIPVVQDFVKRFRAKFNETPNGGSALAYDALLLLADAIARAGSTDGAKIREALAATKDFPGVTGRTSIDAQRNAAKSAAIFTVRDGRARFFQSIAP